LKEDNQRCRLPISHQLPVPAQCILAAYIRILQLENMVGKSLDLVRLQVLAWKFAEGVMTGSVIGVEVEDIRLLRGLQ
jgi:hypothetical protein